MTRNEHPDQSTAPLARTHRRPTFVRRGLLSAIAAFINIVLVLAVLAAIAIAAGKFYQAARLREAPRLPSTMEEVDWHSPDSSDFCLACHKPIGPAMAGLDVKHGHSQNVPLSDDQLAAVKQLGTVVGPNDTLICMSCHTLDAGPDNRYMLADTLAGGKLCEHCHPGHYARNTPHDLRQSAPHEQNRIGQTAIEGGPCSACHLAHRYARDFIPSSFDPDGRCTTCHEIHGAAAAHARTGMDHPEARCLECHDPHDPAHGEFLRADIGQLCVTCHEGFGDGPVAGMHPLGAMDTPLPEDLLAAGAWSAGDNHRVTCVVCHATHTASYDSMLVLEANSNRLCLSCHADKLAQYTHEGILPKHGQSPVLNEEQLAVVAHWDTHVGPNNELLCVSCHKIHGGKAKDNLLAFQPMYGEVCGACHPHHDGVVGTSHDLRTNYPDEQNVIGLTAQANGACSACHLAHRYARPAEPAPGDPSGQCIACHQPDACASGQLIDGVTHPETKCTDCHDPHERRHGNYLAESEVELCAECHADQMTMLDGPHDRAQHSAAWPEWAGSEESRCLACHVAHGGDRGDLLRRPPGDSTNDRQGADAACVTCHPDADWDADTGIAAIHPRKIDLTPLPAGLLLAAGETADSPAQLECRTCHNPHGGVKPRNLARVEPGKTAQEICITCHVDQSFTRFTGHSVESLSRFPLETDSCKPCHAMHSSPGGMWGQMLSPRFLEEACGDVAEDGGPGSCVPCLACHHAGGLAPVNAANNHPAKEMFNSIPPDDPGYLPLFDRAGHVDPEGQIVCRTCHLSHGQIDLLKRVEANQDLTPAERSSMRMQLRPFVEPNVCTECHGVEARVRFLFYHDPDRRAFPREDPTNQRRRLGTGG